MDLWGLLRLGKTMYDNLCTATDYNTSDKQYVTESTVSRGEAECKRAIEELTGHKFIKTRFLKNPATGHQLELDCYCPQLKLAVEYNGRQHYAYVKYFHGENKSKYTEQRYRDEIKKLLCKDRGIKLIEVPYTVSINRISRYIKDCL
ncbi:hypothetical protein [Scale drop disease virus]|uniref:ORF_024R n=1 Tax=Scale drop disease virus TaxID=1697349 RepID=A0A0K1L6E8_9VIRU|nr:ORF_024R [Scale drop disease virus]AKU37439.1 ORF_024R [Scale drop disease virus]QLI60696.1 hypothetical protein [Scale drop disease virus]QXJ13614.1 ORF024R [Scale drop disease virus]UNH60759.1 hypothetical protein SDDV_ORF090 [Scale drop disease virus]